MDEPLLHLLERRPAPDRSQTEPEFRSSSGAILQLVHALFFSAMRTAEEPAIRFESVTGDFHAAVVAFWCERMNGAFERVKDMPVTVHVNLERFIVRISAYFALSSHYSPLDLATPSNVKNPLFLLFRVGSNLAAIL